MDIDNQSRLNYNYHTLTLSTPIAHKIPGEMEVTGGELTAGDGTVSLVSDGYYNGTRYVSDDHVLFSNVEAEGYYKLTASGKGEVTREPVTKQVLKEGFFAVDSDPIEVVSEQTVESNVQEKSFYLKKSTLSDTRMTPTAKEQTITISEGYYPTPRTVYCDPIGTESIPTTSISATNMAMYFYSSNANSNYDITVKPQYSNSPGYVIAHTNATNGGIEYYRIKRSGVATIATTISDGNVTRGKMIWGTGWIESGKLNPATFRNEASSGSTYTDISDTTEAPVLKSGDYLYINAGYTDNLKISLAKLVPDNASSTISANYILADYSAYNNDGNLVTGNIQTYDGSYTLT